MNVNLNPMKAALILLAMITCAPRSIYCTDRRLVGMTLVRNASSLGAYCLDGSLPAYHLDKGFGAGRSNWLLQFEGGGWCNDIESCSERAGTRRGSTRYMSKLEVFSGILSNNASLNPGASQLPLLQNATSFSLHDPSIHQHRESRSGSYRFKRWLPWL